MRPQRILATSLLGLAFTGWVANPGFADDDLGIRTTTTPPNSSAKASPTTTSQAEPSAKASPTTTSQAEPSAKASPTATSQAEPSAKASPTATSQADFSAAITPVTETATGHATENHSGIHPLTSKDRVSYDSLFYVPKPTHGESTPNQSKSFIIKFVASEPCGLIDCLATLAKHPHSSNYLRNYVLELHPLSKEEQTILDDYHHAIAAPSKQKPKFGRIYNISDSLYALSSQASSIDKLLSQIQTNVTPAQFATIKTAITHFAPIYHSLIWEPCQADLAKQRKEFENEAASALMAQRLMEVQVFMSSHWPIKNPFVIALVPIPASSSGKTPTSSHSFGNVQVVQVVNGQKFAQKSDIVFHELVHALWHSRSVHQNRVLQKKYLNPTLTGHSTIDGATTLHELNEGIATALGQGWFQNFVLHQPHYGNWCTDTETNDFAHRLRPLAAYYLNTSMPIDNIFIQNSIYNFKYAFPSAYGDPHFVFNDLGFYSDSADSKHQLNQALYTHVPRAHNVNFYAPLNTSSSKRFFNYYKDMTAVFLVSPEQLDSLKSYGISSQVIADVRSKADTNNGKAVSLIDKNRWLVFCIGKDKDAQINAFSQVVSQQNLQD